MPDRGKGTADFAAAKAKRDAAAPKPKPTKPAQFDLAGGFAAERIVAIDRDTRDVRVWHDRTRCWGAGDKDLRAEVAGWLRLRTGERYTHGEVDAVGKLVELELIQEAEGRGGVPFDARPGLLGLPDGMVADLTTGEVRDAASLDRVTLTTAVTPDEHHPCPRWRQFLREVTCERDDLRRWLLRAAGYTLWGDPREDIAILLKGAGENGKGILIGVLREILGDYAGILPEDFFRATAQHRHSTELADLHRRRLIAQPESADGRWVAQRLKILAGGDSVIRARRMRQDQFDVALVGVLWSGVNNTPTIGGGKAIERRIRVAPFDRVGRPDRRLRETLRDEYPGILHWLIMEAVAWRQDGLGTLPDSVRRASSQFLVETARPLDAWFADSLERDPDAETAAADLVKDAREWHEEQGFDRLPTAQAVGRFLTDRGFVREQRGGGVWVRIGVTFQ